MQLHPDFLDVATVGGLTHLLSQGWDREPADADTFADQACHSRHVSCAAWILLSLLLRETELPLLRCGAGIGSLPMIPFVIVGRLSEGVVWGMGWLARLCCSHCGQSSLCSRGGLAQLFFAGITPTGRSVAQ